MKKLDPVVIIVDVLLLVGCGCMFLYGKMSAHTLFIGNPQLDRVD